MNKDDMQVDYTVFCRDRYKEAYYETLDIEMLHSSSNSQSAQQAARLSAQKKAIDKTFGAAISKYSASVSETDLWAAIAMAHKITVANLDKYGIAEQDQGRVISDVLSAHQSWIKSSGHSFERFISGIDNADLQKNEIRFILQSELTSLIRGNVLKNTPEDINGLNHWGKDFDLYAIQSIHGDTRVFGCIQSKTSIRDRVGRDVGFSKNAMDGLFWSVAVTLDGSFLNMPEFIHMVNSGGSYPINGWHGMYAIAGIEKSNGRIYKDNDHLDTFISHAIQAANQFIADRRMLNNNWIAK